MRCEEVRAALAEQPAAATRQALAGHLAACAACARYEATLARLDSALRAALVVEPPPALQAQMTATVLRKAARPRSRVFREHPLVAMAAYLLAGAAALVLSLASGPAPFAPFAVGTLPQIVYALLLAPSTLPPALRDLLSAWWAWPDVLYGVVLAVDAIISSPAIWVLGDLADHLLTQWFWAPAFATLWLLERRRRSALVRH